MTLLCTLAALLCALVALAVGGLLTDAVLVEIHADDQCGEGNMR